MKDQDERKRTWHEWQLNKKMSSRLLLQSTTAPLLVATTNVGAANCRSNVWINSLCPTVFGGWRKSICKVQGACDRCTTEMESVGLL